MRHPLSVTIVGLLGLFQGLAPAWQGGTVANPVLLPAGSTAAPSWAWAADADGTGTGMYRNSANGIAVVIDGTQRFVYSGTAFSPNAFNNTDLGTLANNYRTLYVATSSQGGNTKTLTESSPTEFVRVAVPQTAGANFAGGTAIYTAYATDGTDTQSISGEAKFTAVNKAGTETCGTITDSQAGVAVSTGTFTCTITCVTGLTDVVGLAANCVSSLTQTTLSLSWRIDMPKTNTVTAQ